MVSFHIFGMSVFCGYTHQKHPTTPNYLDVTNKILFFAILNLCRLISILGTNGLNTCNNIT